MLMRPILGFAVALPTLALAGCIGADEALDPNADADLQALYEGLEAEGAEKVLGDETVSFVWQGVAGYGGRVSLATLPNAWSDVVTFDVGPGVGYIELNLSFDEVEGANLNAFILDGVPPAPSGPALPLVGGGADGPRTLCGASTSMNPDRCTTPVPPDITAETQWAARIVTVNSGSPSMPGDEVPFTLTVTIHPPSHIVLGELAGIADPALSFAAKETGFDGGEPTLGLLDDGSLFVVNGRLVLKSVDDGDSWTDVTPPYAQPTTLDPMLRVDARTNRVILDHLNVACSWIVWSDDGADTWLVNPAACGFPVNDHQKLAVGGTFLPAAPYDGIIYRLFSGFGYPDVIIARSLDGGVTWQAVPAISPTIKDDVQVRRGGPVEADLEGNVYAPGFTCGDEPGIAVAYSNDHGGTYAVSMAGTDSIGCQGIDPGMAIDTAGNAYVSWEGPDAMWLAASTDHGATWLPQLRITPPQLRSFVLSDVAAGDAGKVAVAFLATPDSAKGPNLADGWARWYLFVAISEDALAPEPTWRIAQVTPTDDPVQVGTICTSGIGCSGGNRNLLDFIDVQLGPDGRVYVAYTDGCYEPPCHTPADSRENKGYVAVQTTGPMLLSWAPASDTAERSLAGLFGP